MKPCYGIDFGYVCHLKRQCARVTPEATVEHAMLCEHLEFPHFLSIAGTTLQTLGRLRREMQKRGIHSAAAALQQEMDRFFEKPPEQVAAAPGADLAAAWRALPQMELFA